MNTQKQGSIQYNLVTGAFSLLVFLSSTIGFAFMEDHGSGSDQRSVAHYDLTRAFAICAGFSYDEAVRVAAYDQATDSVSYGEATVGFSDRRGENRHIFHYPATVNSIPGLRSWAYGRVPLYDQSGVLVEGCYRDRKCCDSTSKTHCVNAGSSASLGVFLHAVADYYSHKACSDNGGTDHHDYNVNSITQSTYCPKTSHDLEWGGAESTLYANTLAGLEAVRDEMIAWRRQKGHSVCTNFEVTNEMIAGFVNQRNASDRAAIARTLAMVCSMACLSDPVYALQELSK